MHTTARSKQLSSSLKGAPLANALAYTPQAQTREAFLGLRLILGPSGN
jgi:hypothetical protein